MKKITAALALAAAVLVLAAPAASAADSGRAGRADDSRMHGWSLGRA